MRTSTETDKLADALAKAQAELQNPKKNREVKVQGDKGSYTFEYATLDVILAEARPVLGRHGLSLLQGLAEPNDHHHTAHLTTRLQHVSGQWVEADTPILQAKPGAQAMGGAISYARRYGVVPLLALAADEDDDANAAEGNLATKRDRLQPTRKQAERRFGPDATKAPLRAAPPPMREPGDDDEGPDNLPVEDEQRAAALPPAKLPAPAAPRKPVTHAAALDAAAKLLPWIVEDAKSHHATCRKHPVDLKGKKVYLLRYEGVSAGGTPWAKYNCPMKDPDGNARGFCKTSDFVEVIFGEGAT